VPVRQLATVSSVVAAAYFVDLFLPWFGPGGHSIAGWGTPVTAYSGLLALGVVLVGGARELGTWTTTGSAVAGLLLAAATGVMAITALINLRWGGYGVGGFSGWRYGAWIGLAVALVLLVVVALQVRPPLRSSRVSM
jgi:hypothetical protein